MVPSGINGITRELKRENIDAEKNALETIQHLIDCGARATEIFYTLGIPTDMKIVDVWACMGLEKSVFRHECKMGRIRCTPDIGEAEV